MNQLKKQQIRACSFEMEVTQGTGNIKFPCFCYVEWKTNTGKDVVMSPNRVKLIKGKLNFEEKLTLTTPLVYDLSLQAYSKKQSVVILNLLSNSRPNEPKLVGRVTIQLSSVANGSSFDKLAQYPLQFCSVDATLTFRVTMKDSVQTNLVVSDFEKSDYGELEPIVTEKRTEKEDTKSESGVKSISSANISSNIGSRLNSEKPLQRSGESSFQDRINRIKSQNENLMGARHLEGFNSRLKRQMEAKEIHNNTLNLGSSREQKLKQYDQVRQLKSLSNDLSVPILTKNSDEFDSNKVSEKTIQNPGKSEKQMLLDESPSKKSEKVMKESNGSIQDQFHSIKNQQFSQKKVQSSVNIAQYEQKISNYKEQIERLTAKNNSLIQQLQAKAQQIIVLKAQSKKHEEQTEKIIQKLSQMRQFNYPHLVEQLNRSIQQKDRQIQSLIGSTFETEKMLENIQSQHQQQVQKLKQRIKQLQELNTIKQKSSPKPQASPARSNKSHSGQSSSIQVNALKSQIQDLTYDLQIERKNNENVKIELTQLQQWYKEIQEQSEKLTIQNEKLKNLYDQEIATAQKCKTTINQLYQEKELGVGANIKLQQKQEVIKTLTQQLNQLHDEFHASKQANEQLNIINSSILQQLNKAKKELDDLQAKYVEQEQKLKNSLNKIRQYSSLSEKNKAQVLANASTAQRKSEQLEDSQRKLADLIKRMKDKEENLLKLQRESEQMDSKLKTSLSNNERLKERAKNLENEKTIDLERIKSLEKQNRLLKSKTQREQESMNREINKLKLNLQNQNSKKKQLSSMLNEVQNRSKSTENFKIRELEKKINKYIEKQQLLKDQLQLIEHESNKISEIMQEKQENEQRLTQSLTILNQENTFIKTKISQLQNQCELLNERNQGLEAQIELLNAYQPNEPQNNQISDLNKKLIEKNKELLHQIEEKNMLIAQLQKNEGQFRGKQIEQFMSTSRIQKERQEYEERYQQIVDENEKLYKEFQKLNNKYRDEINQTNQTNEQKVQTLELKMEEFFIKLTEKDVKYAQLQMKSKQDFQKLMQSLHEKQYRIQYYSNEIKELSDSNHALNEQIGQKQFQLHLAEQKIKQLFENIALLSMKKQQPIPSPSPITHKKETLEEEIEHYKSKVEFYEAEIQRLHEKQFIQEKDLITFNEELTKLKENGEEEIKHIAYLEGELKNFRERQTQYIKEIDDFATGQNLLKSRYSRLQKDRNELHIEIQRLNGEIATLKAKVQEKGQEGTPISKFKESPSPSKLSLVDISDIVGEINSILTRRKQQQELESALRLVIDNNARQEQQFQRWSRQRGLIQEKAKLISKEIQKVKSNIMKTANKSIAQKTQLTNLLKPTEVIINDLINISEHLIELDPYEEQEEQFENNDQRN